MKAALRTNLPSLLLLAGVVLGLTAGNTERLCCYGLVFRSTPLVIVNHVGLNLSLEAVLQSVGIGMFFMLVGLELKREFDGGALSPIRNAIAPALAALLGVLFPAAWFAVVTFGTPAIAGWPIPTATDVTFALAVFVTFGRFLPQGARIFLLGFAVFDDVIAVLLIAFLYSGHKGHTPWDLTVPLIFALIFYGLLRVPTPNALRWLQASLAALSFAICTYTGAVAGLESALVGLLLAFAIPKPFIHRVEARLTNPVGLVILPLFAVTATAVPISVSAAFSNPVFWAVVSRPLWKFLGVFLGGWIGMRWASESMRLSNSVLAKVAVLGGIGFTVSLLVVKLAYGDDSKMNNDYQQAAILATFAATGIAAVVAAVVLSRGKRTSL